MLLSFSLVACGSEPTERQAVSNLADGFVKLSEVDPTILQDMRYYGSKNFVGRRVEGYEAGECILTERAATALAAAQSDFAEHGFSIIVLDCYRPQRAVDDFVSWAAGPDETTKPLYYQNVPKDELFERGYIARRSGHSRGSTVDLALVPKGGAGAPIDQHLQTPCLMDDGYDGVRQYLNFGTSYDCFDVLSHTANREISAEARKNRALLVSILAKYGFQNYANEWWHFTFQPEPFPETYFDFEVK
ncbi:MAG: M15 family metallopeptidase [Pseudomonadota bacterium]